MANVPRIVLQCRRDPAINFSTIASYYHENIGLSAMSEAQLPDGIAALVEKAYSDKDKWERHYGHKATLRVMAYWPKENGPRLIRPSPRAPSATPASAMRATTPAKAAAKPKDTQASAAISAAWLAKMAG